MNIRVVWDNPSCTIIHTEITGDWDWNALYELNHQVGLLLDTINHPADLIVELGKTRITPQREALQHLKNLTTLPHANMSKRIVIINLDTIGNTLLTIISHIHPTFRTFQISVAQSLDQARAILAEPIKILA